VYLTFSLDHRQANLRHCAVAFQMSKDRGNGGSDLVGGISYFDRKPGY
jgi:hypothetical protein